MKKKEYYLSVVVFFTGGVIMAFELIGSRILAPVYGVGLCVWASLISVTLISLSMGYWLGGYVADRRPNENLLYLIVLLAGVLLAFSFIAAKTIFVIIDPIGLRMGVLTSSLILFSLPLILLAMPIPFCMKLQAKEVLNLGIVSGKLYAISTMGSVAGTLTAGLFLIPVIGTKITLFFCASILIIIACLGWLIERKFWLTFLILILLIPFLRLIHVKKPFQRSFNYKVLHQTENYYGQIKVVEDDFNRYLLVNGVLQSRIPKMMKLFVYKGALLANGNFLELLPYYYPDGRKCLLIGLGAGFLPSFFKIYGWQTEVVEINAQVAQIAQKYFNYKGKVTISDGRYYLQKQDGKFDFIILDAYNAECLPHHLFTIEMFKIIKETLNDKGIFAIDYLGTPREKTIKAIYTTLDEVFPYVKVYAESFGKEIGPIFLFARKTKLRLSEDIVVRGFHLQKMEIKLLKTIVLTDDRNPIDLWRISTDKIWRVISLMKFGI